MFLLAFFLSLSGASIVSRYGSYVGLLDVPSDRSSHQKVTSTGGGVGILVAFIVVSVILEYSLYFFVPVVVLSFISLIGDRIDLSPYFRLIVQFGAASIVLAFSGLFCLSISSALLYMFFLFFIVGTANFFNFMDGINGIAGITGLAGFLMLGMYAISNNMSSSYSMLSFSLSAACAGFLPLNFPKAKVFLGDVGSVLLGFLFAYLVVVFSSSIEDFIVCISFMFPFYADELSSMFERIMKKKSLLKPHRAHLYQILVNEAGWPHWVVTCGYGLVQIVVGLVVWWGSAYHILVSIFFLLLFLISFIIINCSIKRRFLHC